jgi:hypothetical protein
VALKDLLRAMATLVAAAGFDWMATDEGILANWGSFMTTTWTHRPYRRDPLRFFSRSKSSDLIGFNYMHGGGRRDLVGVREVGFSFDVLMVRIPGTITPEAAATSCAMFSTVSGTNRRCRRSLCRRLTINLSRNR